MTEQIMADVASPARASRRGRAKFILRQVAIWLFAIIVVMPIALVLLFRFIPPPTTPLILGTMLTEGSITQRWVPLESISPHLVRAVIASEDGKFCSHYGFDLEAIDKAFDRNAAGGRLRGASTISQQTAKNLFLLPDRTWTRKGFEAYFTLLIESLWPKRRIMETYLNIAEWGPRRFGAEAAARGDFGKAASELDQLEAARLATILPSPRRYSADEPGPFVIRQSRVIYERIDDVRRDRLDWCIFQ
jgi:monofunctional biosynthetic peptidoglycan transglycosylase